MCRLLGKKKFRYIGITISVNVLNKSRGSEMHWVGGGGGLSPQRDNISHVMFEPICVNVVVFYFFSSVFAIVIVVFLRIAKKRTICLHI